MIDRKSWTQQDRDRLCELVDAYLREGRRPKWDLIATDVGHPHSSCRSLMSLIRSDRRYAAEKARKLAIKQETALMIEFAKGAEASRPEPKVKPKAAPKPAAVIDLDHRRCTSTASLMRHAETVARAGNWFGDPAPGRSALDRMRAGLIEQPRQPSLPTGA